MANNKDFIVKGDIEATDIIEGLGTVSAGTEGYHLTGASYDSVSFSVSGQDGDPYSLFFRSDGAKMYVAGDAGNDINEYNLSTPWTVSSASYSQNFSVASQESAPNGVFFKTDGTKMFVVGTATDTVYEYALSSAWDISSASYSSVSFSVGSQDTAPTDISFNTDGTKMFIVGNTGNSVYEYALSSAWVVSSASYTRSFSLASQETGPTGLFFSSDGLNMVVAGAAGVNKYVLSSAFDISSASHSQAFTVSSQENDPQALFFKSDGTKMYVLGSGSDTVFQYSTVLAKSQLDLSTGSVFNFTPTSNTQVTLTNPADSGTVSQATLLLSGGAAGVYDISNAEYSNKSLDVSAQITGSMSLKGITFNNTGTNFYILTGDTGVSTNDAVYQYTLSTAFDLSTGSYASKTLNVGTRETTPTGISFNTNGTKLFIIGYNDDLVETWNLSTGYDISTATYASESFNISAQEDYARHINFNNDGTKMYITGNGSSRVQEYALSTAFDVTTATFTDNFNPTSQAAAPFITLFNNDGTKMYIQNSDGNLYQYALSTPFDVSTGSYDSVSFTLTQGGGYQGSFIGNSGLSFYSASDDDEKIYQYNTVTPATITYDPTLEWPGGTAPTSPAIGETDVLTFSTSDGGATYKAVHAIDGAK